MEKNNFRNFVYGIFKRREFGIFIVIIVVMLAIGLRNPIFFTTNLTLDNYKDLFFSKSMIFYLSNSIIITISATISSLLDFEPPIHIVKEKGKQNCQNNYY